MLFQFVVVSQFYSVVPPTQASAAISAPPATSTTAMNPQPHNKTTNLGSLFTVVSLTNLIPRPPPFIFITLLM